jgi:hypothetical protein
VLGLTRPAGPADLVGPEPTDENGQPLAPADAWGHDHLARAATAQVAARGQRRRGAEPVPQPA